MKIASADRCLAAVVPSTAGASIASPFRGDCICAKIFNEYAETNILVEGHTDNVGTDAYNMRLSKRRATAVGNYLTAAGVSSSRFTAKWYGESQPKVENNNDENKALNRRVQFVVTANENMKAEAKKEAGTK